MAGIMESEIKAIFEVLCADEELSCGDSQELTCGVQDFQKLAQDWYDCGFTSLTVKSWLAARCYSAIAAKRFEEAGLTPEQAAETTDKGLGGYVDTIGYKVANRDMTTTEAVDVLEDLRQKKVAQQTALEAEEGE